MPGQEAVRSINGPMSSSLDAIKFWAKTVVDGKPWEKDPGMIPIPWREVDVKSAKLSFGMLTSHWDHWLT
jgi:amidase